MRHFLILTPVLLLVACSTQDPTCTPTEGTEVPDAGSSVPDAGSDTPDAGGQTCVPNACAASACGAQPDGCGGTMLCAPCPTETLVEGLGEVRDFQVGAAGLFWLELDRDAGVSTVRHAPLSGGAPEVLTTGDGFEHLTFDGTHVYVTDWGAKQVGRAPLDGGTFEPLAINQGLTDHIAVDGTHVYWTGFSGSVSRIPLAGGTPVPLTASSFPSSPQGLTVDADHLFVGTFDGTLWRATLDGRDWGPIRQRAEGDGLTAMVMDATHLYWADSNAGRILRISKDGGPVQLLVKGEQARDLEVDEHSLYWTASSSIRRMPKEGGPITDVAVQLWGPGELELEGPYLYWLDEASGTQRVPTIRRIRR